nr:hypothetical protein [Tanacetum cinerariifolium]
MLVQAQGDMGKGLTMPSGPQHTPPIIQPTTYKPKKKQKPRKLKTQDLEETQPSGPTTNVADEALNEENVPTQSNDPPFSRVNTLGSGEDRLKLNELMELCTKLSKRGRINDEEMFDTDVLNDEKVVVKDVNATSIATSVTIAVITAVSIDDITLAQALVEIKTSKPKAKSIVIQEPSETPTTTTIPISSKVQDKGKDADYELAVRLQEKEQSELIVEESQDCLCSSWIKERSILQDLEQRRKPLTKAQKKNQICIYLKNMAGFTHNQLKNKSFNEVQKAFEKTMSWINLFVPMDSEVVKDKAVLRQESSSKRAGDELDQEKFKK